MTDVDEADDADGAADETDDVDDALDDLYHQLAATEELPVEREAGYWLGEAQAVVDDLRVRDADDETRRSRLATVAELLDEFETTGDPDADDHAAAARRRAAELRVELRDESKS